MTQEVLIPKMKRLDKKHRKVKDVRKGVLHNV